MSSVSAISAVGASSASAVDYLPTLMSLQSDLMLYSRFATGSSAAATDFKDFAYAIEMRNIANAQAEFARLQRDSEASSANPAATPSLNEPTTGNGGVAGQNSSTTPPPAGSLVDVTA